MNAKVRAWDFVVHVASEIDRIKKVIAEDVARKKLNAKYPHTLVKHILDEKETLDFLIAYFEEKVASGRIIEVDPGEMCSITMLLRELRARRGIVIPS